MKKGYNFLLYLDEDTFSYSVTRDKFCITINIYRIESIVNTHCRDKLWENSNSKRKESAILLQNRLFCLYAVKGQKYSTTIKHTVSFTVINRLNS